MDIIHWSSWERRVSGRTLSTHADYESYFPLARKVSHKSQKILMRWSNDVLSSELLIDAPEEDIRKYLSEGEISFDIFFSQIIAALLSGEHKHVNIELSNLQNQNFLSRMEKVLRVFRRKNDRTKVIIEVTERGSARDVYDASVRKNLLFLKHAWFSLCVDDFRLFPGFWPSNDVSRLILSRYKDILSGVKIPYEYKANLWDKHHPHFWHARRAITTIPLHMKVIAEGKWLKSHQDTLSFRINAIQDPEHNPLEIGEK